MGFGGHRQVAGGRRRVEDLGGVESGLLQLVDVGVRPAPDEQEAQPARIRRRCAGQVEQLERLLGPLANGRVDELIEVALGGEGQPAHRTVVDVGGHAWHPAKSCTSRAAVA